MTQDTQLQTKLVPDPQNFFRCEPRLGCTESKKYVDLSFFVHADCDRVSVNQIIGNPFNFNVRKLGFNSLFTVGRK